MTKVVNKQVKHAGYYYIGHFMAGQLRICFDDCEIRISPKCDRLSLLELLEKVFEINTENGIWFESITGKYCRLIFAEDGSLLEIQHIVNPASVLVSNFQKPVEVKEK